MKVMYSPAIDAKWQKKWADSNLYHFDIHAKGQKLYLLEMFSYPSASKLHMGHWWNYSLPDSWGRMKRMQGYNVFHPMGFDAFGLPAENFAIKTGIHPKDSTEENISTMEKQLSAIGCTYDWSHEIKTCDPSYYKWTQWLFLQLYKHGLAYKKEALVNWCNHCNTVLANEQAQGGECERCHSRVEQRYMNQWFLKITQYADELLADHAKLNWPERTKAIQRNWIGRSTGAEVSFRVKDSEEVISVFTTRVDTLMGLSYVVLAPESPLTMRLTTPENMEAVKSYVHHALSKDEIQRTSTATEIEKTGVFSGSYAIHPLTNEPVPVWIADYVIGSYGTGAVMAVPAHDERDFAFATKYGLPIKRVISDGKGEVKLPYCEKGILVNSGKYDGMDFEQAKTAICRDLSANNMGRLKTTYRLRDWSVSRQRYWGCPIPIIYCDSCGIVPVPEKDLPVELPYNVSFMPTGESPLKTCEEFMNTTCPRCGKKALRETDTLDTFVCSSWYQLRYLENTRTDAPWGEDTVELAMPVDKYVGGIEHAAMHLLYCRFVYKALRDMGYVKGDEPYPSLIHQGVIFGPDGARMSKTRGNTVAPDEYVSKYGSDIFRTYLAFGFEYTQGGAWKDSGIEGIAKFFDRVSRMVNAFIEREDDHLPYEVDRETDRIRHLSVKAVTADVERFQFNTAVARLMEFCTAIIRYQGLDKRNTAFEREMIETFIKLFGVFAPHYGEEMWEGIGNKYSLFNQSWPEFDQKKTESDQHEIVIQICGKIRDRMMMKAGISEDELQAAALERDKIRHILEGKQVKRIVVIKNRLVNIVI